MSSRRYIKRVWRVPKDFGPVQYLGHLVIKALRKHGWPAEFEELEPDEQFRVLHDQAGADLPHDFATAVEIAVRILARTYRVDVHEACGVVTFNRPYRVAPGGHFREIK